MNPAPAPAFPSPRPPTFGPRIQPMSAIGPFLILAPLLAGPTPARPPIHPTQAVQPGPSSSAVRDSIDRGLRWLRSRQDEETGAYGGVVTTSEVLLAFTESPRAYRAADGPFVARALEWLVETQAPDGSIADPGAGERAKRDQTRHAILALTPHEGERPRRAATRARAFVGPIRTKPPGADPAALASRGARILARQLPDGGWESSGDRVRWTASMLGQLNALAGVLEPGSEGGADAARTAEALPPFAPADRVRVEAALRRGADYLLSQRADETGGLWGFQGQPDPGITAMVTGALLTAAPPRDAELQRTIDHALDFLVGMQKSDGSIHAGQLANYVTSASIMALAKGGREKDLAVIARARAFLELLQSDEGEGYSEGDRFYGGVGYGGDERPDLSNLQMALEALSTAGLEHGDETFQKALVFLQRCQNRSESSDLSVVRDGVLTTSGNDGGSGYAPGESKAGFIELADGRRIPRSYGSMTYALLKGYLFAGLPRTDPRVEAAWRWLRENYTLDVNPGFEGTADPTAAYQGLYYYFTTMARALDLYGEESVVDAEGRPHAWRSELCGRLTAMQRQDGSWINENASRWYEGNPVLATAYALTTLDIALPAQRKDASIGR